MSQTEVQLIKDAVIVNADISNSAAIDVSKISGAMPLTGGTFTDDVTFTGANANIVFDKSDNALEFGNDVKAVFGADSDLEISHENSTDSNLINSHKELKIYSNGNTTLNTNNADVMVKAVKNGAVELYYDNEKMFQTNGDGSEFFDSDSNLNIYFTTNDTTRRGYIFVESTSGGKISFYDPQNHPMLSCTKDGPVELFHDNALRLDTHTSGVTVHTSSGVDLKIGTNDSIFRTDANMAGIHFSTTAVLPTNNVGTVVDNSINLFRHPSYRWANIYTTDLILSNEGSQNDVDSTWGNYTIQEGHEDLFLINHRTGKKFKFVLAEVA